MTTILDTNKPLRCGSCQTMIWPSEPKVIIGYYSLIIAMHPNCWEIEKVLRKA